MLTYFLIFGLVVSLGLIVVRQRNLSFLLSVASLFAALLTVIWLQNQGLLPGTQGPLSEMRPQTQMDAPRPPVAPP